MFYKNHKAKFVCYIEFSKKTLFAYSMSYIVLVCGKINMYGIAT